MRTIIILVFFTLKTFGQKTDTLYINECKFPLTKTKVYYNSRQKGFPSLPSEYLKTEKKDFRLNFKYFNEDQYKITYDPDGSQISIVLTETRDSIYKFKSGTFTFNNIVDTVIVKKLRNNLVIPYLKIDSKKYFLTSSKLLKLSNDTLTECMFDSYSDPLSIDFNFTSQNHVDEKMLFILTDLYYRKNNVTYYLDKAFLIRINYR